MLFRSYCIAQYYRGCAHVFIGYACVCASDASECSKQLPPLMLQITICIGVHYYTCNVHYTEAKETLAQNDTEVNIIIIIIRPNQTIKNT